MDERQLDDLLRHGREAAQEHTAPGSLRRRILELTTPADPLSQIADWLRTSLWRPLMAAALPLALGFSVGVGNADVSDDYLAEDVSALMFADPFDEIADED